VACLLYRYKSRVISVLRFKYKYHVCYFVHLGCVDDPDLWNQTLETEELLEAVESHQEQLLLAEPRRSALSNLPQVFNVPAAASNIVKKRRLD